MAYIEVPSTDGLYMIDYDLVNRILHDSYYLQGKYLGSEVIPEKEGWGLPETYFVKVPYKASRVYAETMRSSYDVAGRIASFMQGLNGNSSQLPTGDRIESFKHRLHEIERAGRESAQKLKQRQDDASRRSMRNINKKVDQWGTAVEVAKFTRNASADVLLVGGSVVTGGSATLALGAAGSIFKGAAKYQDTGNLAASVVEANVSFVTFFIPGPKDGMSKAMARTLIFTKAKTEFAGGTAVGLAEGKDLAEAAVSSGVDVAFGLAFDGLKGAMLPDNLRKELLKDGLKDVSVPVAVGIMDSAFKVSQGKLSEKTATFIMNRIRAKPKEKSKVLRKIAFGSPVLVDLAVLGPDRSTAPRYW
jgi:hypothetical protein